jgi:ferric iron reductase protein FhuF
MTLDEVLVAVAQRVPYLRASVTAAGDSWVRCDTLLRDPALLLGVVERAGRGLGADDPALAASLFAQAYVFRAAGVTLAACGLGLPVPDPDPATVAVRIDKPRPTAVAHLAPAVAWRKPAALARALVVEHFEPFVAGLHGAVRVGERLLWGNVAASCAAAFRAVEGTVAERGGVRARAEAFMAGSDRLDGLGTFTVVHAGDREGWYWDRTSCCLWYQVSATRQLCDNCSLLDAAALRARRRRELVETAS